MRETWVRSVGWEDPQKKGMATHSSILAWRILVLALLLGNLWERRGCNASEVVDPRLNHFKQPKSMHPGVAETQHLQESLKFTNVENTGWGRIQIEYSGLPWWLRR